MYWKIQYFFYLISFSINIFVSFPYSTHPILSYQQYHITMYRKIQKKEKDLICIQELFKIQIDFTYNKKLYVYFYLYCCEMMQ